MEYIKNLFKNLAEFLNLGSYAGDMGLVPIVFIALAIFLFILELLFYALRRPRGLSNMVLIVGILGTFASLYVVLKHGSVFNAQKEIVSAQLLYCALVGLVGGVLAVILSVFESLYYSNVNASRSIDRSVKDLVKLVRGDISQVQKNLHVQLHEQSKLGVLNSKNNNASNAKSIGKSELQHISQQIYDLTHHLKQEFSETRERTDENTKELVANLSNLVKEVETMEHNSAVLGPKIVAKTSVNSQLPSSNDSTIQFSK